MLDSNDEDLDSRFDYLSNVGEDVDVHLNHYRIPKLSGFGLNGANNPPKLRINREQIKCNNEGKILSLIELTAQKVACHLPFGVVEQFSPPVPPPMQCRIAFWSFPQDEEDIRLYTCLANGNADVFMRAEDLIHRKAVCDMLQVGFHLSANVRFYSNELGGIQEENVAVTFDRRKILTCNCSCSTSACYCQHAVAVCLQRIRRPQEVTIRAPISESLQRLDKNQLQKLAQYLINESPQQFLPPAQNLIDELLKGDEAVINQNSAAPDPTAGAAIGEQTSWFLDHNHLSYDIERILLKQCTAQPTVCDVQSLHITAPPASTEYSQLLRPIRGREPEGLWNLILIAGEMMKRRDSNCIKLLDIITEEVMKFDKIVTWWFETTVSLRSGQPIRQARHESSQSTSAHSTSSPISQTTSQYSCSNFSDEIVHLWRLAALNPSATASEKQKLYDKFFQWHLAILKRYGSRQSKTGGQIRSKYAPQDVFPGFKAAMEGCLVDWSDWDGKRGSLNWPVKPQVPKSEKTKKRKSSKRKCRRANRVAETNAVEPSTSTASPRIIEESQANNVNDIDVKENGQSNNNEEIAEASLPSDQPLENVPVDDPKDDMPIVQGQPLASVNGPEPVDANIENPIDQEPAEVEQDLQVYFMEQRPQRSSKSPSKPESFEDCMKINLKKLENELEVMYAKAEGLNAHGHTEEARRLAVWVSESILSCPDYHIKQLCLKSKCRKKPDENQISIAVSEALSKITFLCNILTEELANHRLIFNLVLFGLRLKRYPAATKPFEVKLINQKQELITILKYITIHDDQLEVLRDMARSITNSVCESGFDPMTTLMVGNYLFEVLVLAKPSSCANCATKTCPSKDITSCPPQPQVTPRLSVNSTNHNQQSSPVDPSDLSQARPSGPHQAASNSNGHDQTDGSGSMQIHGKLPVDENLGFEAAVSALGVKINVSETKYPLSCEGIRRLRGELALSLLTHYKDEQEKIEVILKNLLNNDVILPPAQCTNKVRNPTVNTSPSTTSSVSSPAISTTAQPTAQANGGVHKEKPDAHGHRPQRFAHKSSAEKDLSSQPIEASAHFMFELAKTIFDKAGGNSLTAHLFRPQLMAQNGGREIHRNLHMCTLRVALYALGLQNQATSTWMQRTYSGRASFIHEQALEIGFPAIKFLSENWEGYLTPVEAASIADKAGVSDDLATRRVAAEMAKSCLKFTHYLDLNFVTRIFAQCKEQTVELTESACNEIEKVADEYPVCADILFVTAKIWYNLSQTTINGMHVEGSKVFQMNMPSQSPSWSDQDNGGTSWPGVHSNSNSIEHSNCTTAEQVPSMLSIQRDINASIRSYFSSTPDSPFYTNIDYLRAAWRVGIKALDALNSTPGASKYYPKKKEEILWLFELSKFLGRDCVHRFSQSAEKSITDPHLLETIIYNITILFGGLDHIDKNNILLPVVDRCLERCAHQAKDITKQSGFNWRGELEATLDMAQRMTSIAHNPSALETFSSILESLENNPIMIRNPRSTNARFGRVSWTHLDTRREWVDRLLCSCDECRCFVKQESERLYTSFFRSMTNSNLSS